jgi:hypothetical protein
MIRATYKRGFVLIPMRNEPAIRQRLQPYFSAEPVAQEYPRLERLAGIAVEPLSDLPAVKIGGAWQYRQHLGRLLRLRLLSLQLRRLPSARSIAACSLPPLADVRFRAPNFDRGLSAPGR